MKSFFASSALVASLFNNNGNGLNIVNGDARATFGGNNGINGYVDVMDGGLMIMLNISDLMTMNYSGVPDGESCFTGGLKYHIHERWDYSSSDDLIGSDACSGDYTGGHWDPWLGCGSATGNEFCTAKDESFSCVPGSSAYGDGDGGYQCSTDTFAENAYACEVGDWNGKYGLAMVDDNGIISISGSSAFEVSGDDVVDMEMSVVFHCNAGARAFCAPFESSDDDDSDYVRPTQGDDDDTAMIYAARFDSIGNNSGVLLYSNGTTLIALDVSDFECDDYSVRIYNSWSDSAGTGYSALGDACTSDVVGQFYDPTVSCAYDSDSDYCEDMEVCGVDNATYSCDYENDRFGCAPGDLTGKFSCDDTYLSNGACVVSQVDDLMIDLNLLSGKSVVVQCADDYEIQACAGIFNSDTLGSSSDSDSDDDDSDSDDDDSDSDDDSSANRYQFAAAITTSLMIAAIASLMQ